MDTDIHQAQISRKSAPKPPVVTVLGHVDHGKTTLLDRLRNTSVAAREKGGITQSISGSHLATWQGRVTFLDTPGHEAFEAMRRRGVAFTDLALLVVAADEGVMAQTREAGDLIRELRLPVVVAITKCDAPGADPARVRGQLLSLGLIPEELGGDALVREVSARTGDGVLDLVEAVALQAMLLELRAAPDAPAVGLVLDAMLDPRRGPRARVLVLDGTLRVGDAVLSGTVRGHVRSMVDDRGREVEEAEPSVPVDVFGLPRLPAAGDDMLVFQQYEQARRVVKERIDEERSRPVPLAKSTHEGWLRRVNTVQVKVVFKAPSHGVIDAVREACRAWIDAGQLVFVSSGVGNVREGDIKVADAVGALVLAMGVKTLPRASELASHRCVNVRQYDTIYGVVSHLQELTALAREPRFTEIDLGHASVTSLFKSDPEEGTIVGASVEQGELQTLAHVQVMRGRTALVRSKIVELRRYRSVVERVEAGNPCGVRLDGGLDLAVGDTLRVYLVAERGLVT